MKEKTDDTIKIRRYSPRKELVFEGAPSEKIFGLLWILLGVAFFPGILIDLLIQMDLFAWREWMSIFFVLPLLGVGRVLLSTQTEYVWKRLTISPTGIRLEKGIASSPKILSTVDLSLAECTSVRGGARIRTRSSTEIELHFFNGDNRVGEFSFLFERVLSPVDLFQFLSRISTILDFPMWRSVDVNPLTMEFGRTLEGGYWLGDAKLPSVEKIDPSADRGAGNPVSLPARCIQKVCVTGPGRFRMGDKIFHDRYSLFAFFLIHLLYPAFLLAPFLLLLRSYIGGSLSLDSVKTIIVCVGSLLWFVEGVRFFCTELYRMRRVVNIRGSRRRVDVSETSYSFSEIKGVILRSPDSISSRIENRSLSLWFVVEENMIFVTDFTNGDYRPCALEAIRPVAAEIARLIGCPLSLVREGEVGVGMEAFLEGGEDSPEVDLMDLALKMDSVDVKGTGCPHCGVVSEHRYSQGKLDGRSYWVCISCGCSFDGPVPSLVIPPR